MTIQDVKKKKKNTHEPSYSAEEKLFLSWSLREVSPVASPSESWVVKQAESFPPPPNRPEDIPHVEQVLGALSSQPLQVQKSQGCASSASTPHFLPLDIVLVIIYLCTSHFTLIGDTCTPMFTAALFTIARTWKQPKCPSTEEQIKKMWSIYIYTMEYCSALYREQKGAICRCEWT